MVDGLGRSPHGERGLKSPAVLQLLHGVPSLPSRGVWIEINALQNDFRLCSGRSPHGERGLKFRVVSVGQVAVSRSPHGERGLKSADRR